MDSHIRETLEKFIHTPTEKEKIIIIYGPTACGKTALSVDVANFLDSEILSVDARQIYQEMDIGTGKIRTDEMQ